MKVLLISGSYPPEPCGVGEYTYQLAKALRVKGLDVELLKHARWRLRDSRSVLRVVDEAGADIIHIQYPSVGYGRVLGPQLLNLQRPCVVTIHEVSQAHLLRKLSLCAFLAAAKTLIFTTSFEKAAATRLTPWISGKSTVIPIGSNVLTHSSKAGTVHNTIGYFGLIRPNKGLEQVIELATLAVSKNAPFKIIVIGATSRGLHEYYSMLRQKSIGLPVDWRVGLQGYDLDAALAEPQIAYLPFPDGASERRSSLLTFLSRGTPVLTTMGHHLSEELKAAVQFAANPETALTQAEKLANDDEAWNDLRERGIAYAKKFSWERIAQLHIQLYQSLYK